MSAIPSQEPPASVAAGQPSGANNNNNSNTPSSAPVTATEVLTSPTARSGAVSPAPLSSSVPSTACLRGSPSSPTGNGSSGASPPLPLPRPKGRASRPSLWCPAVALCICFVFDAATLLPLNLLGGGEDLSEALANYTTSAADLWVWLFVRIFVAMGTVCISLFVFRTAPSDAAASLAPAKGESPATADAEGDDSEARPLLADSAINAEAPALRHRTVAPLAPALVAPPPPPLPLFKNVPLLRARDKLRTSQGRARLGLLCVMFFLHMGCNVYVAVKAMRFRVFNGDEYGLGIRLDRIGLAATLLCLHVLSCSVELFITSMLLSRASALNSYVRAADGSWLDDHDVECPLLHPHPLKYISRTVMSSCNVCSTRFRVSDRKFTCDICDFNTCSQCLETKMEQFDLAMRQEVQRRAAAAAAAAAAARASAVCAVDKASVAATVGSNTCSNTNDGGASSSPPQKGTAAASPPAAADGHSLLTTDGFLTAASDKTVTSIGRWAYAKRIAVIANQFRGVLIIGLTCLIVAQVVNIILPKYQGNVIDAVVKKDSEMVQRDIEWYVGLGIMRLLFSSIRTYCTMMTSQYATNTVRIMLFSALTQRSVAFFDATSTGALQSRLSSDSTQMVSPLSTLFNDTISNILVLLGATVMAFIVSWKLALLSFTVLGPIVYLTSSYAQVSRRLVRQIRDSVAEGGTISNQVLTSIRTVKGFANEEYEVERYSDALLQAVSIAIKNAAAAVAIGLATSVMDISIMALTLGFGSYLILNYPDELSIGELITFQLYANMMNSSYRAINNSLNELTKSAGAAERVLALMDVPPTPENEETSNYALMARNGKRFGASPCFSIRFDNVHFRYPNRPINPVLKGLSFVCQPGKVTALVGPSGSGKSTVVQLLQRFYGCNAGRIKIGVLEKTSGTSGYSPAANDNDAAAVNGSGGDDSSSPLPLAMVRQISSGGNYELVAEMSLNEIARVDWLSDVAVVAQDTQLFSTTVFENITYGIANTRAFDGVEEKRVGGGGPQSPKAKKSRKLLRAAKEASEWQRRNAEKKNGLGSSAPPSTARINIEEDAAPSESDNEEEDGEEAVPNIKSVVSLDDVIAAAKKAQAHDFIMKLPEGYYTPIGERGCTLSGGQRQRLAIARALLRRPKLLLLDEATSALDNESEALVQKAIDDLLATERKSDRCTVLVIAHRLTTIQNADNIVVLQDGVVREEGTHTELSTAGGLYQSFLASGFPKDGDGAPRGGKEGGGGKSGEGGKREGGKRGGGRGGRE